MNLDWQTGLESNPPCCRFLAARPIAEKLRLLDALRERELAIRSGRAPALPHADVLRKASRPYRSSKWGPWLWRIPPPLESINGEDRHGHVLGEVVQNGLGACCCAGLHPRRNPLDRECRFSRQPARDRQLVAVAAPARD